MTYSQKSKESNPIGVFDSRIGGLTVVKALMDLLPHENIVYFGDTARVPYGSKSPEVIREYASEDTRLLLGYDVKLIVIACNTVSAVALDVVENISRIPVVGMILPGAEAAVRSSKKKRIGVIGTSATIRSDAYTRAIQSLENSASVFKAACPLFVPLAEEGLTRHKATQLIAKEYLFPLTLNKIDTLVLGCTHYPLLKETIDLVTNHSLTLIDSGEAAARTVLKMLDDACLRNPSALKPNVTFLVSDIPYRFSEVGEPFLGRKLGLVKKVTPIHVR